MVWVRNEYAGEFTVLSAWVCLLLPWNVTYTAEAGGVLFIRFPFFEVQYLVGLDVGGASFSLLAIHTAVMRQLGESVAIAYQTWAVGATLMGLVLALSVLYYLEEERVEASSVDPVRAMGILLVLSGVVFAFANYLVVTRGFPGIPIPIGAGFMLLLGGVLLTVDRE